MRTFALAVALLMPLAVEGMLFAEVFPEVLIAERKEKLSLNDIERLTKEAEEAEDSGNYQKALDILGKILAIEKKELGAEDADVGSTLSWQGRVYTFQGLYDEAEPLLLQGLDIIEKAPQVEHKYLTTALHDLGIFYIVQGQYERAEDFLIRALSIQEKFS